TSTAAPAHGATFTAIDAVTRDTKGRVTGVNTKTVTLPADQNTTYTAGTGITISGTTISESNVTRTNTTSTASPAHGATFTAIDGVTTNAQGEVTGVNTKTITLPADNNTTYTAGTGLALSGTTINAKANNGLTTYADSITLGGALTKTTTITTGDYNLAVNAAGTGRFRYYGATAEPGANKVLTSDASGYARWALSTIYQIAGTVGSAISITFPAVSSGSTSALNEAHPTTNTRITLPPGKWQVGVELVLSLGTSYLDRAYWMRLSLTDSSTGTTPTSDLVGANLISGGLTGPQRYTMISGHLIINNTSNANKTYYVYVYNTQTMIVSGSVSAYTVSFGAGGENTIVATPVGN
ncbi:MAG: hypothetical protein LBR64_10700, partial [Dysgonamonadaceae bacterium]|nr:hypothetical protein [Dysgonamonadaceae bacterium]